jgi:hypothetical protein
VHLGDPDRPRLIDLTSYWFGLLSHRRATLEWKGIVQVELDEARQDVVALSELDARGATKT